VSGAFADYSRTLPWTLGFNSYPKRTHRQCPGVRPGMCRFAALVGSSRTQRPAKVFFVGIFKLGPSGPYNIFGTITDGPGQANGKTENIGTQVVTNRRRQARRGLRMITFGALEKGPPRSNSLTQVWTNQASEQLPDGSHASHRRWGKAPVTVRRFQTQQAGHVRCCRTDRI